MLTVAGLHTPVIPLSDVAGKRGTGLSAQIVTDVPKLNSGTIFGLTLTVSVAVVAHCPEAGVKVYVPEAWLSITDGLHVPVTPLVEMEGNEGTDAPSQIVRAVPKLNVGVLFGVTVTVNVVGVAHSPAEGVNV